MDDAELDRLDRDLTLAAARPLPPFDPGELRRRLRRISAAPWWRLAGGLLVTAALVPLAWWAALLVAWFVLPEPIVELIDHRRTFAGLDGPDELLAVERRLYARQLQRERFSVVFGLGFGGLMLGLGLWTDRLPLAIVAGGFALAAVARFLLIVGPLARANRDVGGEEPYRWTVVVLVFGIFLVAPFLIVWGLVRDTWRRLTGRGGAE